MLRISLQRAMLLRLQLHIIDLWGVMAEPGQSGVADRVRTCDADHCFPCANLALHQDVSYTHTAETEQDVGIAGYHNDALYSVLEPAIRPLVGLLADEEDKTRSNAAGALGNLVRNSNLLCGAMLRAGALEVTALAASCQPYTALQGAAGLEQQACSAKSWSDVCFTNIMTCWKSATELRRTHLHMWST